MINQTVRPGAAAVWLLPTKPVRGPNPPNAAHEAPNQWRSMRLVPWVKPRNAILGWTFFHSGVAVVLGILVRPRLGQGARPSPTRCPAQRHAGRCHLAGVVRLETAILNAHGEEVLHSVERWLKPLFTVPQVSSLRPPDRIGSIAGVHRLDAVRIQPSFADSNVFQFFVPGAMAVVPAAATFSALPRVGRKCFRADDSLHGISPSANTALLGGAPGIFCSHPR